jgi:hypothetical protein
MKMIVLNTEQCNKVAGIYNGCSELAPEFVSEDLYALPLEVLADENFKTVRGFLVALPQEDINITLITILEDTT